MQVKLCGIENCIQLLDKGSGLTAVGKGDTVQHALGDAVGAMLTTLLEKRLLSMHDLCREHIHFPHPDKENCLGVEINTCDLSKPVLPQGKYQINFPQECFFNYLFSCMYGFTWYRIL
jgi:hypothetical protein